VHLQREGASDVPRWLMSMATRLPNDGLSKRRIFARAQKSVEQTGRGGTSNNPTLLRIDINSTKKDKKSDEPKTNIGNKTKGKEGSDDDYKEREDQKGKFRPGWVRDDDSSQQRREQQQAC
jgi:hypothetical protein